VLSGLAAGLIIFAGAFDLPWLQPVREALFRFPPFAQPGPALFAGALGVVAGNLLGRIAAMKAVPGLLLPPAIALGALLTLAAVDPFPDDAGALGLDSSSVENALQSVASLLGAEYRRPDVEEAVRRVVEEKDASLADKERALRDLTDRLARSEADKKALERATKGGSALSAELAAAKKALEEIRLRVDEKTPQVTGGRYDQAVQPTDPSVRDFAVKAASAAPGAWDNPQGSRIPNAAGARQLVLIHAAIASNWKYVSDPAVSWQDYTSPARRSLALGLAGDCDDYATVMASCIVAVGGTARIVHGIKGRTGHAWAEVWVGSGSAADSVVAAVAKVVGRPAAGLAVSHDKDSGHRWLALDWELGTYSFKGDHYEVAWRSAP
jgi:transglutaminase-like putative cysteine protease